MIIVDVHEPAEAELAVVIEAGDLLSFSLGLAKGGQQEPGKDRYDGNHDEQFN